MVIDEQIFPGEILMVMSAMETGGHAGPDRRRDRRVPHTVGATLRLFADEPTAAPRTLYTRDADRRSLGFVTRDRLPLGYGGVVELVDFHGEVRTIRCTVLRCREVSPGIYEGGVSFNRGQDGFESATAVTADERPGE